MINVFGAEKLEIQLSDGRMIFLGDLVHDYERLLNEECSKKAVITESKDDKPKDDEPIELKVGEWFRIDRDVINKRIEEIRYECNRTELKGIWKRFSESNKIANENPSKYPRIIETYIFEHNRNWELEYKTEQQMRDMCKEVGDGMVDEVIFYLELQMRICNGESMEDLFDKPDKLPRKRIIELANGRTGYSGGGYENKVKFPPGVLCTLEFTPDYSLGIYTPYAFRRVKK